MQKTILPVDRYKIDIIFKNKKRGLWHGVITATSPGMTTAYSFDCQPHSFKHPMFFQCFSSIMRTGGGITALGAQPGRNNPLINFYQQDKREA